MSQLLKEFLKKFGKLLLLVLPHSPVQKFLASFKELPYLPWLNWFIPVSSILIVFEVWLAAVSLFYMYSILMRWIKLIGD